MNTQGAEVSFKNRKKGCISRDVVKMSNMAAAEGGAVLRQLLYSLTEWLVKSQPECLLCSMKLANDSMKPGKMKRH